MCIFFQFLPHISISMSLKSFSIYIVKFFELYISAVLLPMGFTYDFYANRWRMCSISYYFRNSSASINNVTNVNYDIDLQKMYMYSCKMPQMVCLTRWG